MIVLMSSFFSSVLFGLLAYLSQHRMLRIVFYLLAIISGTFASFLLLIDRRDLLLFVPLILLPWLFHLFNFSKILANRLPTLRLQRTSNRTLLGLYLLQLLLLAVYISIEAVSFMPFMILALLLLCAFGFSLGIANLVKKVRILDTGNAKSVNIADTLTVSVCIPARNEMNYLNKCLSSIIESDYRKLEILVYDDCSQDKTPDLIKGFAHKGVRFISGKPVPDVWAPRNYAYKTLANASSGQVLIFISADTEVSSSFISDIVNTLRRDNLDMLSVMPIVSGQKIVDLLLQSIRYLEEFIIYLLSKKKPPALSTVWAIRKDVLVDLGGFASVRSNIMPVKYFASKLSGPGKYEFFLPSVASLIFTTKRAEDQYQTALRVNYPRLKHRPESVLIILELAVVGWFLLAKVIADMSARYYILTLIIFILTAFIMYRMYAQIINLWREVSIVHVALLPFAILADLVATLISMYKHEFSVIHWKGRNICVPHLKNKKN